MSTAPSVQQDYRKRAKSSPEKRSKYTSFEDGVIDQIQASEERLTKLIKAEIQASECRVTKRIDALETGLDGVKADIKKITDHLGIE